MDQSPGVQLSERAPANLAGLAALESLARAARQVVLYGPEHPTAAAALEAARNTWGEESGGVSGEIKAEQHCLLWNEQSLPQNMGPVARLHEAMRERLIACIRFEPEINEEDLAELLHLLSRDPQEVLDSGGAMAAFGASGGSIYVEDVDFWRELRESEAEWIEACGEVEGAAVDSLTRIFDCCLRTVRNLGDHRALNRLRHEAPETEADGEPDREASAAARSNEMVAAQVAHAIQCAGEVALMADEEMLLELLHADLKINQFSAIVELLSTEVKRCAEQGAGWSASGWRRSASARCCTMWGRSSCRWKSCGSRGR